MNIIKQLSSIFKSKAKRCIIILGYLLLVHNTLIYAEERKEVKVATIKFTNVGMIENGYVKGLFYDIANLIIMEAGYRPNNHVVPYSRVLKLLQHGDIDFSIMYSNKEVESYAKQLVSIMHFDNIIVGLPGVNYQQLNDLEGQVVISIRNAVFGEEFSSNDKVKIYTVGNYQQALQMLLSKRADAIIGAKNSIYWTLNDLGLSRNVLGKPLLVNSKSAYIQFSYLSKKPEIKEKLKLAAEKLKHQGVFEALKLKYTNQKM
ncbi:substrate-binding periplasmic protein [Thalassotalea atypica]|uniref:substrate-binding periplasmic protein n=1 Tax=Thalassotalea atypica TaxID=2054316 RepID=UPI002573E2A9|nr:transporter substrate-binding domain-containing protein [Thalassotalea atypica]